MALINTPPWLIPTDVIGSMSAGGRLGLGRAELAQHASDTAQRTGLGYAQLGADQASAGAALHAKLAEHALAMALHQSESEEEKRKNQAMEKLRSDAIEESQRKDKAAEALRQQQFTEIGKRQKEKEDAAMKLQRYKTVSSQLAVAQKGLAAAQANGDDEAAKKWMDRIGEINQQMQEFSGGQTPASATPAVEPQPAASLLFPQTNQLDPFAGQGFIQGTPTETPKTKSGNRYSIEPVGE